MVADRLARTVAMDVAPARVITSELLAPPFAALFLSQWRPSIATLSISGLSCAGPAQAFYVLSPLSRGARTNTESIIAP